MGEALEETTCLDLARSEHNIAIAAARGRENDVLVEGERDECHERENVDGRADRTHRLWNELWIGFAQVLAFETSRHE